jgi:hypothetical protein
VNTGPHASPTQIDGLIAKGIIVPETRTNLVLSGVNVESGRSAQARHQLGGRIQARALPDAARTSLDGAISFQPPDPEPRNIACSSRSWTVVARRGLRLSLDRAAPLRSPRLMEFVSGLLPVVLAIRQTSAKTPEAMSQA